MIIVRFTSSALEEDRRRFRRGAGRRRGVARGSGRGPSPASSPSSSSLSRTAKHSSILSPSSVTKAWQR